jgi:hypothetical protein
MVKEPVNIWCKLRNSLLIPDISFDELSHSPLVIVVIPVPDSSPLVSTHALDIKKLVEERRREPSPGKVEQIFTQV